jgi:hypothetical protein
MSDFKFSSSNLDFEGIQTELIDYFESIGISYTDGSNFSLLIKALAYSTMLNSQYIQTAINNLYLGSSNNTESTYLLASQLGYIPRLRIPSRSRVRSTFTGNITKESFQVTSMEFVGINNSLNYIANNVIFTKVKDTEYTSNFIIEEKIIKTLDYYGNNAVNQEIILPTTNISQDNISVKSSISGIEYEWEKAYNFSDIPSQNSRLYFIEVDKDNKVKIIFGNGIVGQKPQSSEKITVTYYTTNGEGSNNETEFEIKKIVSNSDVDINNISNYNFNISSSFGGKDYESIKEIKVNAPKYFSSIGNSIIQHDYRVLETVADNYVAYSNLATVNYNSGNLLGTTYLALVPDDYRQELTSKDSTLPIEEIKNLVSDLSVYNDINNYYNGWVYIKLISPTYLYIDINPLIEVRRDKNIDVVGKEVYSDLLSYVDDVSVSSLFGFNKYYRDSSFFKIINQNNSVISSEVETSYKILINKNNIVDKEFLKIPKNFLQSNEKHLSNLINHSEYDVDYIKMSDHTMYCTNLKENKLTIGKPFIRNIINSDIVIDSNVSKIFTLIFDKNGSLENQDILKATINKKMLSIGIYNYNIEGVNEYFPTNIPLYYSTERIQDAVSEYNYDYNNEYNSHFVYFKYDEISYLVGEVLEIKSPEIHYLLKRVENNYSTQLLFEKLGISQMANSEFFSYKFNRNIKSVGGTVDNKYEITGNVIFNNNKDALNKNSMNLRISSRKKIGSIQLLNVPEISNEDSEVFNFTLNASSKEIVCKDIGGVDVLTLEYSGFNIEIINTNKYHNTMDNTYKDNMFSVVKNANVFEIYAHEKYDGVILADIDVLEGVIYFNKKLAVYKDYNSSDGETIQLKTCLGDIMEDDEIYQMKLISKFNIPGMKNINHSWDGDPTIFILPNLNQVKEI